MRTRQNQLTDMGSFFNQLSLILANMRDVNQRRHIGICSYAPAVTLFFSSNISMHMISPAFTAACQEECMQSGGTTDFWFMRRFVERRGSEKKALRPTPLIFKRNEFIRRVRVPSLHPSADMHAFTAAVGLRLMSTYNGEETVERSENREHDVVWRD